MRGWAIPQKSNLVLQMQVFDGLMEFHVRRLRSASAHQERSQMVCLAKDVQGVEADPMIFVGPGMPGEQ